jgi:hypothetical protein
MMSKISGQVQEAESGRGVPGVIVRAFDKDRFFDDLLGEVMTDAEGEFHLMYDESKFREFFDTAPDIFLTVKTVSGKMLFTTDFSCRSQGKHCERQGFAAQNCAEPFPQRR